MTPEEQAAWHQQMKYLLAQQDYAGLVLLCKRMVSLDDGDDCSYAYLLQAYYHLEEWVAILEIFEKLGLRIWRLGAAAIEAIVKASANQEQMLFICVSSHLVKSSQLAVEPIVQKSLAKYHQLKAQITPHYRQKTQITQKMIDLRLAQLLEKKADSALVAAQSEWYQLFNQLCEDDYRSTVAKYLTDERIVPFVRAEMLRTLACFNDTKPIEYLLEGVGIITVTPIKLPTQIEHTPLFMKIKTQIQDYFNHQMKDAQQLQANIQLLKAIMAIIYPCMDNYPNISQADFELALVSLFVPKELTPAAQELAQKLQRRLWRYL